MTYHREYGMWSKITYKFGNKIYNNIQHETYPSQRRII